MSRLKEFAIPLVATCLLVFSLVLLASPVDIGMPGSVQSILIVAFSLLFLGFMLFVWNEVPRDEREAMLMLQADRIAFLVGAGVMALILVVQFINGSADVVLAGVLGLMVVVKVAAALWSRLR